MARNATRSARIRSFRGTVAGVLAAGVLVASLTAVAPGASAADDPEPGTTLVDPAGIPDDQMGAIFGKDAARANDVAVTVMPGPDGITVLRASSKSNYEWNLVATITVPPVDTDLWIANSCLTSSGEYVAVVYGPRQIVNKPESFGGGAFAAIVDLSDGSIEDLGFGYSIAYFDPGCGLGDHVALTRTDEKERTLLAVVDASSGKVTAKFELDQQATSPVPVSGTELLVATGEGILSLKKGDDAAMVVKTKGFAYELTTDSSGRVAYATHDTEIATAFLLPDATGARKPAVIARGPLTSLGIESRTGGGLYVLGPDVTPHGEPADVIFVDEGSWDASISSTGLMAVNHVKPAGMASAEKLRAADLPAQVLASAVSSGEALVFDIDSASDATADTTTGSEHVVGVDPEPDLGSIIRSSESATPAGDHQLLALDVEFLADAPAVRTAVSASSTDPYEGSGERYCAVPRNDPSNQALQPKPRQVEWAVDMAVANHLTSTTAGRPNDWRNLGMAAYNPGTMFPPTPLSGGGTIPPQIMLGILAQESNLWQASRFTVPGETGNPLIGDYYGNRPQPSIWNVNFPDADCGYGVGQITDGMRLAGKERPGEVALPFAQQRAIALDYVANVAKAVQMLGVKWNQVRNAGMQIHDGSPTRIENWFFAVWAYNTGFYQNGGGPWGVGWSNNPINPNYPPSRSSFLNYAPWDAANPGNWPYPERVMGFAAWSLTLTEKQVADPATRTYPLTEVVGYRLAWWVDDIARRDVKPPLATFCSMAVNDCDPTTAGKCTLASYQCWWHDDVSWKADCSTSCGWGFDRFSPWANYTTEEAYGVSFPAACSPPPYSAQGTVVVDSVATSVRPVRLPCTKQPTTGSFSFQFFSQNGAGNYPARVDLHQLGSGFNGQLYFSHMRRTEAAGENAGDRAKIVGTWNLGQTLNQWTRIWIHLPDHAAWTEQAAYTVDLGNGTSQTRYVQQRTYKNGWVQLGVFDVHGVPKVSLSNMVTRDYNVDIDDVAWDAVAFQPLPQKPRDFVVALGDSFASGEGAGSYAPASDHDGNKPGNQVTGATYGTRSACHQSANAWIRKTVLPGRGDTVGNLAETGFDGMDFHLLACSGAESEQLLPFHSWQGPGSAPENGKEEQGNRYQYGLVSQLDQGYLDDNTTLVTLSIGGNDMRFADILLDCVGGGWCEGHFLAGDSYAIPFASADRFANELPVSLDVVLEQIKERAPNALIALVGYPKLFEIGGSCVMIANSNTNFLNQISTDLTDAMEAGAALADEPGHPVIFVDPQPYFTGHNLCQNPSAINGIIGPFTPGDKPLGILNPNVTLASQQSVHPNEYGTTLYSDALEDALDGVYP